MSISCSGISIGLRLERDGARALDLPRSPEQSSLHRCHSFRSALFRLISVLPVQETDRRVDNETFALSHRAASRSLLASRLAHVRYARLNRASMSLTKAARSKRNRPADAPVGKFESDALRREAERTIIRAMKAFDHTMFRHCRLRHNNFYETIHAESPC